VIATTMLCDMKSKREGSKTLASYVTSWILECVNWTHKHVD